ncbi:unnamed protein product [Urochloa humidicola]
MISSSPPTRKSSVFTFLACSSLPAAAWWRASLLATLLSAPAPPPSPACRTPVLEPSRQTFHGRQPGDPAGSRVGPGPDASVTAGEDGEPGRSGLLQQALTLI